MSRLGHPVCLDHRHAEGLLELLEDRYRQRCRGRANETKAVTPNDVLVVGAAREESLVHRGYRGQPGRLELTQPVERADRMKPRTAGNGPPGIERGEKCRDEPVDMKERHQVQTSIVRPQRQRLRDMPRRRDQIALRERYELGTRSRSRGVEKQSRLVGATTEALGGAAAPTVETEDTCSCIRVDVELDHSHTAVRRGLADRRIDAARDDDRSHLEIGEVEIELLTAIGRVEGRAGRRRGECQERGRRFRAVLDHECNPIVLLDAAIANLSGHGTEQLVKGAVVERAAPGRQQGGSRRVHGSDSLNQLSDRVSLGHFRRVDPLHDILHEARPLRGEVRRLKVSTMTSRSGRPLRFLRLASDIHRPEKQKRAPPKGALC